MAPRVKKHQTVIPDADGDWTVVAHCGKQRRIKPPRGGSAEALKPPRGESVEAQPWAPTDTEVDSESEVKLERWMMKCVRELENSKFFRTFIEQIETAEILNSLPRVLASETKMQMVIYGIGSIDESHSSRLQLSLAILLKKKFDWVGDIEVFDPIISTTEKTVIERLGCSVLLVNEEGRRHVLKPTLFFMPHCEKFMYENLLVTNWRAEYLNRMVILGNRFDLYDSGKSNEAAKYILRVRRFSTEVKIATVGGEFVGSFHDLCWHFFNLDPKMDLELQSIEL